MLSVANLYWILTEQLLKPCDLDCWYFYPFGTIDNMSKGEFVDTKNHNEEHHALFQFDQEPIWDHNHTYGETIQHLPTLAPRTIWTQKLCRLLANSEHSAIKKRVCREYNMLDWYFFYHGLAALDWFRDARYINLSSSFKRHFVSLNHLAKDQRSYRMALIARLIDLGLHEFGDISLHATAQDCRQEISNPYTRLGLKDRIMIGRHLCGSTDLPFRLDQVISHGDLSAIFGAPQCRLWQNSFLHIVNETVFYEPKLHLTEKVFKPIVVGRPFVLAAAPGNLAYLRSYGFKTFDPWIDESYDQETDPTRRLDLISAQISRLCGLSHSDLHRMYQEMTPVLEHNRNHFFGDFRRIIVDELVDNFDQCIRLWNNGRVDGRQRPMLPDLAAVKQNLLR